MTHFDVRLVDSLEKVLPGKDPKPMEDTQIIAWPGEVVSFQIAARALDAAKYDKEKVQISIYGEWSYLVRCRKVVLEPVLLATYSGADDNYLTKTAAMLPDPLVSFSETEPLQLRTLSNQWDAIWCDLTVPADFSGEQKLTVSADTNMGQHIADFEIIVCVQPDTLPEQKLIHSQWFHADCLAEYYGVEVWSEAHWQIVENHVKAAASYGINMLLTPLFTPALDTVVGGERPTTQLVKVSVSNGEYSFDFRLVDRWIEMCCRHGIREFEICHFFTQWGAAAAPKVMATVDGEYKRIFGWDTPSIGGEYTRFLRAFIPEFKAYMKEKGLLDHCWFHISDEPTTQNIEQWNAAKMSISDLLEGCHMIDALHEVEFYKKGYIRTPVAANDHIEPFVDAKVPELWTYYCCSQTEQVPNRFIAMPSARTRILGVLLYRYDLAGFLQWGFNFYYGQHSQWKIDPWQSADGTATWPAGDPFLVYPGKDGEVVESIRGLVLREGMQDLRLLRLAEDRLGRSAVLQLLEDSWDGGLMTMKHYPTDPEWFMKLRKMLINAIAGK